MFDQGPGFSRPASFFPVVVLGKPPPPLFKGCGGPLPATPLPFAFLQTLVLFLHDFDP